MNLKEKLICKLAAITRKHHLVRFDRLLRCIYSPDRRKHDRIERVILTPHNLLVRINTASYIEWQLFFYGDYEAFVTRLFDLLIKPGSIALDVGANVGIHALRLGKLVGQAGKVYAFEPHPFIFKRMTENIALNQLTGVIPVQLAVSSVSGSCRLQGFDEGDCNQGTSFLVTDEQEAGMQTFQVAMISLDDWAAEQHLNRVDLIKIDVEGFDIDVLQGAKRLIVANKPAIIFEYGKPDLDRLRAMRQFLEGEGYALYVIQYGYLEAFNEALLRGNVRILATANRSSFCEKSQHTWQLPTGELSDATHRSRDHGYPTN